MEHQMCLDIECQKVTIAKSNHYRQKSRMDGPDGGLAWIVAFAACVINFIMSGLGRMSGILFVAFIEIFTVDRKSAAMPLSIRSSTRNLFGPVVGILGQKYGARKIIVIGGIIATISSALCFFTADIIWITILWGVINGVGCALIVMLPQVVIGQYFDKYRTTAVGVSFSGGCVGSFIFPALLEYLIENFGIEGTFLIISAIIMHTIPAALILKKPSWFKEPKDNPSNLGEPSADSKCNDLAESQTKNTSVNGSIRKSTPENSIENSESYLDMKYLRENKGLVLRVLNFNSLNGNNFSASLEPDQNEIVMMNEIETLCNSLLCSDNKTHFYGNIRQINPTLFCDTEKGNESITFAENRREFSLRRGQTQCLLPKVNSSSDFTRIGDNSSRSFVLSKLPKLEKIDEQEFVAFSPQEKVTATLILHELHKLNKLYSRSEVKVVKGSEETQTLLTKDLNPIVRSQSNSFLNHIKTALKLYLNPLFLMVCLCRAAHFVTFVSALTTVVDFSMDKGLPEEDGKYVIASISVGDLLGRVCLGWITDRGFMSLHVYMMVVMVIQGISTASLPLMNSKMTIFANFALFGMLQGSLFVRHPVLISKYMRSDEQSIAMGCIEFFSGFLGFGLPLYIGFFRDTMGSYDCIFYINGVMGACVGLLWVFEPFFLSCVDAKKNAEKRLSVQNSESAL